MITCRGIGWKILRDMGLLLTVMMGLLTVVETMGTATENWMQLLGPVGVAMLLMVVWHHLRSRSSVGLRGCALLMLMTLTMQLQQEELDGSMMHMGLTVLGCTAAGLLLGMGILMLMHHLPEKRWITMAGVGMLLMFSVAPYRLSTGLLVVFLGLIVQGMIYGSDCSDGIRVRESLLAFFLFALFLMVNAAAAEVILLAMTMLVLAVVLMEDRRWSICLAAVLTAVAFSLLLTARICWDLYHIHGRDVPWVVNIFAKLMYRFRLIMEQYLDPAGADIYNEGYQLYRVREALCWASFIGRGWGFFEVPQAYTACVFTTFVVTFGILPAGLVLVLMLGIFRRSASIAMAAQNRLEGTVGLAFGSFLMLSGLLSAAGNLGLLPLMGYTFPILADSGTSLVMTVAMMACLALIPVTPEAERRAAVKGRAELVWSVGGVAVMLILMKLLLITR